MDTDNDNGPRWDLTTDAARPARAAIFEVRRGCRVGRYEHFYERLKAQNGIYYFTSGGSAKLRKGNINVGPLTDKGFDQGCDFMLIEIAADELHFQVISDQRKTIDSRVIRRQEDRDKTVPSKTSSSTAASPSPAR
jgi:hypothetical protein